MRNNVAAMTPAMMMIKMAAISQAGMPEEDEDGQTPYGQDVWA
jgi:hypothetical protein